MDDKTTRFKPEQQDASLTESQSIEKFLKSLETAKDFRDKHDKSGGFTTEQLTYLSYLAYNEEVHKAIKSAYDCAFRRGYQTAVKELRAKDNRL